MDKLRDELAAWFQDFIEWNASNQVEGVYRCNQCRRPSVMMGKNHDDDCDVVTAKALLDQLRKGSQETRMNSVVDEKAEKWTPCADAMHDWKIRVYPTDSSELLYIEECQKCFLDRRAR